jgi:hypothetical protein
MLPLVVYAASGTVIDVDCNFKDASVKKMIQRAQFHDEDDNSLERSIMDDVLKRSMLEEPEEEKKAYQKKYVEEEKKGEEENSFLSSDIDESFCKETGGKIGQLIENMKNEQRIDELDKSIKRIREVM